MISRSRFDVFGRTASHMLDNRAFFYILQLGIPQNKCYKSFKHLLLFLQ